MEKRLVLSARRRKQVRVPLWYAAQQENLLYFADEQSAVLLSMVFNLAFWNGDKIL